MKRVLTSLFLLVAPMAGQAQAPGERLLAPIPQGYVLGHSARSAEGVLQEYIPAGETLAAWSQMMTIRDFPRLAGVDPEAFHANLIGSLMQACPGAQHAVVTATVERGAPVHILLAGCPTSPVTGGEEWFLSKAIGGQAALYNVQGAWRGPATRELVEAWTIRLRDVAICDPARADRPCPGP
jgi:hypothetical protein